MERIALYVEGAHLGIADLDAFLVGRGVERALDFQAGFGRGCGDQLDDGQSVRQRSAAPSLRDVAEHAVLDLVPLRRAGRIVVDVEHEARRIGELLQLDLPQPHASAVGAAAVRRDRQLMGVRVAPAPHRLEPAANGGDGELGRVAGDADADPARIARHIIDAVRHDLAQRLVLEIVDLHAPRITLGPIVGAAVFVVADELLLLGVDRDDGLARGLRRNHLCVDVLELRVAVGMLRSLVGLAVRLPPVAEARQQALHAAGADLVALLLQRDGQLVVALRHPQQGAHGIAERGRLDDAAQVLHQRRVSAQRPPAATGAPNPPLRQRRGNEIRLAAAECRARNPGDLRDRLQTTPTRRPDLSGCEHPPPALIELAADGLPAFANRLPVDHADPHTAAAPPQESRYPNHITNGATGKIDSHVLAGVLRSRATAVSRA